MKLEVKSLDETLKLGARIGALLRGGEVIELVGDIGAGKTTFTRGIAKGLGIDDDIQSPTFTLNRVYSAHDDLRLSHYDFYRLNDAGIMAAELEEAVHDEQNITVIEWGDVAAGVLPDDRLTITITSPSEKARRFDVVAHGSRYRELVKELV